MRISRSHRAAFSLIECLVYLSLFVVIVGLALEAYYRMSQQTRGLTSNTSDISRAVRAGERWRADLRLATAAPVAENDNALRITQASGPVRFLFRDDSVWRQVNDGKPQLFLTGVRRSMMQPDQRPSVAAWRWEVELKTRRAEASVHPLFTFIAVPQTEKAQ